MAGGGGFKKKAINYTLDNPVKVYLGLGAALWAIRQYQVRSTYNWYFGKIDFERRKERGQL